MWACLRHAKGREVLVHGDNDKKHLLQSQGDCCRTITKEMVPSSLKVAPARPATGQGDVSLIT